MKPIEFDEQNVIFAEHQDQYRNLPALREDGRMGRVVSCWKLTWYERLKILFTGKIWSCLMTFHNPVQPQFYTVHKSEVIEE